MNHTTKPLSDKQLLDVLSLYQYGIAVHIGPDSVIQYANDAMIAIWGKDRSVIGKSLEAALPELEGQPFIDMFKQVWNEGITISGTDTPADLIVNGTLQTFYFDFEYRAVLGDDGKTMCILHTATDVTARYESKKREQNMAEEVLAINEELSASNEELLTTNEELLEAHEQQRLLYEELQQSSARFRSMVQQAPIGICIIRAEDLYIQDVNDAYLELVGRHRSELENKTIWEAIPEAADAYAPIMSGVIATGIAFVAKEHEVVLVRNGVPEAVFLDFVYEPIKYYEGTADAIMVLVIDVTEKVLARRSIEEVEERVRLAVEAAEIGTYDVDLLKGTLLTSGRYNEIFGFDKPVPLQMLIDAIHPDDKQIRQVAYDEAMKNGKLFYEARIIHPDGSVHWIRAQGKVVYKDGTPARILGTVLDITRVQRLNQQKDDFISIASHELKTPITSLKASLQLMDRMKEAPSPDMMPKLIEQANRSMQKISSLIEDLLNVSRANESKLSLNKTNFTVAELLNSCCSHIRAAGKYHIIVKGDDQVKINADEHAIDQVVVNLVNNAVKYAPDSLIVTLGVEKLDGSVKISVTDKGPGIASNKIPHLFDRYYQGEVAGFQNSGLGLGLYISAEIVKRHGGKIGVDSEVGKGSTFWFTLPVE
ncbi:PAS domain-containing protein [Mucilaginibacter mali]|uniref:histidine kinase n=1 Tax=Mucilaginibacter mali TaxID=2740462 RepID=A0A7D4ULD3_9SPHI|nr:PAS domain-containing sensor histidine kinase [Mucilaginibacter mali]QKJ29681.1 PAS domain-containing protein [Mucilaginibacter mali]